MPEPMMDDPEADMGNNIPMDEPAENVMGDEPIPQDKTEDSGKSETGNSKIDYICQHLDDDGIKAFENYGMSLLKGADKTEDEPPMDDQNPTDDQMPMEGKRKLNRLVNEIVNNILLGKEADADRRDKKIRNGKASKDNPFISGR